MLRTLLNISITSIFKNQKTMQVKKSFDQFKPPNILIYCQPYDFPNIKWTLLQIVNPDRYAVYHVDDKLIDTSPWQDNVQLLLVKCNSVPTPTVNKFLNFFENGGKLLCLKSSLFFNDPSFYSHGNEASDHLIELVYKNTRAKLLSLQNVQLKSSSSENIVSLAADAVHSQPLIIAKTVDEHRGCIVSSLIDLEYDPSRSRVNEEWSEHLKHSNDIRLQILKDILSVNLGLDCERSHEKSLTPCYVVGDIQDVQEFSEQLQSSLAEKELKKPPLTLRFCEKLSRDCKVTQECLPVVMNLNQADDSKEFDIQRYLLNLNTKEMGRVVFFTRVLPSTMNVTNCLTNFPQTVAVARRQTQGRGRSGNVWLSPEGCALFSFPLCVNVRTELGQKPIWVQHLAAIAMVDGVLGIPGYQNLDLRIKWPNDVYVEEKKTKIGGLIVTSTLVGDSFHCVIGCGLNVNNSIPTMCVNDLVHRRNLLANPSHRLEPLAVEEVIARTLSRFEELVALFQSSGFQPVLDAYMQRWMHGGAEVDLQDGRKVKIIGLDDSGYLKVVTQNGLVTSLESADWNSFDLMRNLVTSKISRQY